MSLNPELFIRHQPDLPTGEKVLHIYAQPVNFQDANGTIRPIDHNVIEEADGFLNATNSAEIRISKLGSTSVTLEGSTLEITPVRVEFDDGDATTAPIISEGSIAEAAGTTVSIDGDDTNLHILYRPIDGGLKEILSLDGMPSWPVDATVAVLAWALSLDAGMALAIADDALHAAITVDGGKWGTIHPLTVTDAAGAQIVCPYMIGDDDTLQAAIPLAWMRDSARVWPIEIDPTVTASTIASDGYIATDEAFTGSLGEGDDWKKSFLRFVSLPTIAGTVTEAVVNFFRNDSASGTVTGPTTTSHVNASATFDDSATAAALDAIILGDALDSHTIPAMSGWHSWNVTGDASKGMRKVLADGGSSAAIALWDGVTAAAAFVGMTSVNLAIGRLGSKGVNTSRQLFNSSTAASNKPYLSITHDGIPPTTGRAPRQSGSAGGGRGGAIIL